MLARTRFGTSSSLALDVDNVDDEGLQVQGDERGSVDEPLQVGRHLSAVA